MKLGLSKLISFSSVWGYLVVLPRKIVKPFKLLALRILCTYHVPDRRLIQNNGHQAIPEFMLRSEHLWKYGLQSLHFHCTRHRVTQRQSGNHTNWARPKVNKCESNDGMGSATKRLIQVVLHFFELYQIYFQSRRNCSMLWNLFIFTAFSIVISQRRVLLQTPKSSIGQKINFTCYFFVFAASYHLYLFQNRFIFSEEGKNSCQTWEVEYIGLRWHPSFGFQDLCNESRLVMLSSPVSLLELLKWGSGSRLTFWRVTLRLCSKYFKTTQLK